MSPPGENQKRTPYSLTCTSQSAICNLSSFSNVSTLEYKTDYDMMTNIDEIIKMYLKQTNIESLNTIEKIQTMQIVHVNISIEFY